MDIHLECYLIFIGREAGLELREDIETVLEKNNGYLYGTNDYDT